jgi:putative tryptophan/tyrosine transport system substrate-binding protein
MILMQRRAFLTLLGAAATGLPRRADAQSPSARLIGFLSETSPDTIAPRVAAFRAGLSEIGFAEGRDVIIDWRSAERQTKRLRALAADLVGRRVGVIVTASDLATAAAKAATQTIPIVFLSGSDPIKNAWQGGNVTGLSWFGPDLAAGRLSLLRQLVPQGDVFGLLVDSSLAEAQVQVREVRAAADLGGIKLVVAQAASAAEIDAAFTTLMAQAARGLVVGGSDFFTAHREQLIELAARNALAAIYPTYEMAADGGLASYGHSASDAFRRAGVYVAWILQGASPASLPVVSAAKIELAINLKTAKTLGLEVTHNLIAGADTVIQ